MIYKDFIINLFITRGSVDNREFESKFSEINFLDIEENDEYKNTIDIVLEKAFKTEVAVLLIG